MMPAALTSKLSGWGNCPVEECEVYRPERVSELIEIVREAHQPHLIARGLGRSYGDAALNRGSGVVQSDRLDRMLDFDPGTGILTCEAAVSLAEIIEAFLPRGFFFPVTPGTKFCTLGGAIAADVHGKNHHKSGSMSAHLIDFRLVTARGEILTCSRDQHPDLFWATIGGMGLTGAVVEARVRLRRVETAYMRVDYEKARDLDVVLERCAASDDDYDYGVAWIDCLSRGRSMGRSVLMRANHALPEDLDGAGARALRGLPRRLKPRVPFMLPNATLNLWTMSVFNEVYYRSHRSGRVIRDCDTYFYPLDAVHGWNRVYGRRGVLQYQFALPAQTSREALVEILGILTSSHRTSFLTVLKSFGAESQGLLSFPRPGFTLSLDLPHTGDDLIAQLHRFDQIVARHGGRIYLAKDVCLRPELVGEMYPRLARFREIKAKVDPEFRFSSSQARRLGIAPSR
jgi:FAD/FMN-containing dehydrogenase